MPVFLPNGIKIDSNNLITATERGDDDLWMDKYEKYLNTSSNSIAVKAGQGNDKMDAGNLFNNIYNLVGPYVSGTILDLSMHGEDGDDIITARRGGTTRAFGGEDFDIVHADLGDVFITLDYDFEVIGDELHITPKQSAIDAWRGESAFIENTRLILDRNVEWIQSGGEYLLVDNLFNGEFKYFSQKEFSRISDEYRGFLPLADENQKVSIASNGDIFVSNITNNVFNITNNVTTTNVSNTGNGNISIGSIGTVNNTTNIDNSFTIQATNVNLSIAITGDSKKSEKVEGTAGDDLITDGLGKDKLIGGDGADQFYFSGEEPFKKKTVDKIIDFDASEGDAIVIADEVVGDLAEDPTMAIADTKKDLRELSKDGYDLLYFEPKGDLYVDGNGDSKGFGKKSKGGMIADLPNDTTLTEGDVLIGV